MTLRQRQFAFAWAILGCLAFVGWVFQDNAWLIRGAFVLAVVYFLWNLDTVRLLQRVGPTPAEVIKTNALAHGWVVVVVMVEISVALFFLLSGRNLGDYIGSYWLLFGTLVAPLALPVLLSQLTLFRRLRHVESKPRA